MHFWAGRLESGLRFVGEVPWKLSSLANNYKAGFISAISGIELAPGWLKCFQVAWFIGFLGGGLVYYVICLISPPPGRPYVRELFGNEHREILDGVAETGSDTPSDHEKAVVTSSTKNV